jgi:hypothetical protein
VILALISKPVISTNGRNPSEDYFIVSLSGKLERDHWNSLTPLQFARVLLIETKLPGISRYCSK